MPTGGKVEARATGSERVRCEATRRDGARCAGFALPGSCLCFAHDPERQAARAASRRKGGRNSAKVIRLRGLIPPRLLPVYETLEAALQEVHDGKLDPRRAVAMASLARAMVAVLTAGELEERLRRLEGASHGEH